MYTILNHSKQSKPFRSILKHFEYVWSILIEFEPLWLNIKHFDRIWIILIKFETCWNHFQCFYPFSSARFYLDFPTGKLFGKLSFLQKILLGEHTSTIDHFRANQIQNDLMFKIIKHVLNFSFGFQIFSLQILKDFLWNSLTLSIKPKNYPNFLHFFRTF